jgi:hypothetical protein
VRLWKIDSPEEYAKWVEDNHAAGGDEEAEGEKKGTANGDRIRFQKGDVLDAQGEGSGGLGGVRAGAPVTFALCVDKLTATRVAGNITVNDDVAAGGEWPQVGVVEFCRGSADGGALVGGYIRCIPSDEKLPWLSACAPTVLKEDGVTEEATTDLLQCGVEVFFEVRNRGGVRYASRVSVLCAGQEDGARKKHALPAPVCQEKTLDGACVGVIVSVEDSGAGEGKSCEEVAAPRDKKLAVFPLLFSECPEFASKAPDIAASIRKVLAKKSGAQTTSASGENGTDDSVLWQKKVFAGEKEEDDSKKEASEGVGGRSGKDKVKAGPTGSKSSVAATLAMEGVPVYYPSVTLAPVPIEDATTVQTLQVGAMVSFRVVVNWALCRAPLRARQVTALEAPVPTPPTASQTAAAESKSSRPTALSSLLEKVEQDASAAACAPGHVRGVILRLKISNIAGPDLTEIALGDLTRTSASTPSDVKHFYCYSRDLKAPAGSRVSVGDEVEFLPVSLPQQEEDEESLCVAVCPSVLKGKAPVAAAVSKKRVPVNASLKQSTPAAVFKNIVTMAEVRLLTRVCFNVSVT